MFTFKLGVVKFFEFFWYAVPNFWAFVFNSTLKFIGGKLRNETLMKLRRVPRRAKMHTRNQSKIIIEIFGQFSEIMFMYIAITWVVSLLRLKILNLTDVSMVFRNDYVLGIDVNLHPAAEIRSSRREVQFRFLYVFKFQCDMGQKLYSCA